MNFSIFINSNHFSTIAKPSSLLTFSTIPKIIFSILLDFSLIESHLMFKEMSFGKHSINSFSCPCAFEHGRQYSWQTTVMFMGEKVFLRKVIPSSQFWKDICFCCLSMKLKTDGFLFNFSALILSCFWIFL